MTPTPSPDKLMGLFRPKQAYQLVIELPFQLGVLRLRLWWWNFRLKARIARAKGLADDLRYLSFVAWHDGDDEASKEFHKAAAYVEKIEGELRQLSQGGTDAASGS